MLPPRVGEGTLNPAVLRRVGDPKSEPEEFAGRLREGNGGTRGFGCKRGTVKECRNRRLSDGDREWA